MRSKWSFFRYMQERLYAKFGYELYKDRLNIMKSLSVGRLNYSKNRLLKRAEQDLSPVEFELCQLSHKLDAENYYGNTSFKNIALSEEHFDFFLKMLSLLFMQVAIKQQPRVFSQY